jgi:glycerophosphoryl diester phosphodiesterase
MKKTHLLVVIWMLAALTFLPVQAQELDVPDDFDVQGHRAARGLKPENTLPAIEAALDLGVTTIELDLHYTADGEVVIWHDDAILGEFCELPPGVTLDVPESESLVFGSHPYQISSLTLAQVQSFQCNLNPDPSAFPEQNSDPTPLAGDDYRIPTLEAVFEFVIDYAEADIKTEAQREHARNVRFNLETKRQANRPAAIGDDFDGENAGAFELATLDLIEAYDLEDRVIVQSFDHRSIWAIHTENPDITIAALTNRGRPRLETYVENGASIWSPRYTEIDEELIVEAHELGLKVIPWTVNDADDMRELIAMGVDGIITDRPDILLDIITNG